MQIIPAVDLKDGKCVRLTQGRFDQVKQYSADPVLMALRWVSLGASRLHAVDLDGARDGAPNAVNVEIVREITARAGIPVELGGGIRNIESAKKMLDAGVDRVVIGTAAVSDPNIGELFAAYGDRVIVGIDAVNGLVAVKGWQESTSLKATDFAKDMEQKGAKRIIFTDISRDGMLRGPNIDALEEMLNAVNIPVIASGGVSTIDDIFALAKTRAEAVITGKALYEGALDLAEAIKAAS
jgi:phosphoribosylformimino-5-aminoimidazole carboxamide ribotide isomerase